MPRFVVERLFDQKVEKLTPAVSQKAMRLIHDDFPTLVWEHSHIVESTDDGMVRTFCIYVSPDQETIRAHAESVGGHVVLNVYELAGDVARPVGRLADPGVPFHAGDEPTFDLGSPEQSIQLGKLRSTGHEPRGGPREHRPRDANRRPVRWPR